jgi:hypothetical protein
MADSASTLTNYEQKNKHNYYKQHKNTVVIWFTSPSMAIKSPALGTGDIGIHGVADSDGDDSTDSGS